MNWFTKGSAKGSDIERMLEEGGGCEHVMADHGLATHWSAENDSFGSEPYVYCQDCWNKAQEEEDNQLENCHDCGEEFRNADLLHYKYYGFYAPQGDEPLLICEECRTKERHLGRLEEDRRNQDYDDDQDDDVPEFMEDSIDCDVCGTTHSHEQLNIIVANYVNDNDDIWYCNECKNSDMVERAKKYDHIIVSIMICGNDQGEWLTGNGILEKLKLNPIEVCDDNDNKIIADVLTECGTDQINEGVAYKLCKEFKV